MHERMTSGSVCEALRMTLWRRRRMPRGVLVHSDRGSQYCYGAYQGVLGSHALVCRMSGEGNCYGDAVAESFFHTLKVEPMHGERPASRAELRKAVF